MRIAILSINRKRRTGLETWKNNLIEFLKEKNEVRDVYTNEPSSFFRNLFFCIRCDLVQSYSQTPGTILILLLRKLLNKKLVHTIHGDYYQEKNSKKGIKRILWVSFNKLCGRLANKVTFPSLYLYNQLTKKEPKIKSKSVVIPNGININELLDHKPYSKKELGLEKNDFLILEVTNFNLKEKAQGIDLLVNDFKIFNEKTKNSYLFIVGSGKNYFEYKDKYESSNIKFLGFRKDVFSLIKSCDLFVHYSFLDSFGYIILEAMACKKPVITWGSPAFEEIGGKNKRLIGIKTKELNKYKIDNIKKFDYEEVGKKFNRLYEAEINQ